MPYHLRSATRAVLVLAIAGCGPRVQPGLANAPALGKVPSADERVTDATSNGRDSCGRLKPGPGPLRFQVPPCPTVEAAPAVKLSLPAPHPAADGGADEWVEHYWNGWPCPRESYCAIP
ncbi:MAG TPA: hypothetical protein VF765_27510 [Polyangiaceae bacterium]